MYLNWLDPRARDAMLNDTAAAMDPSYNSGQGCGFPCSLLYAWTPGDPW